MPDFQALIDAMKAAGQAQFDSAVKAAHDQGFDEGVASVPPSGDPGAIQALIDAAVAAKVLEIKDKLSLGLADEQSAEAAAQAGLKAIVDGL